MTDGMLEEHEAEEGIRLSTDRVIASQHRTLERLAIRGVGDSSGEEIQVKHMT